MRLAIHTASVSDDLRSGRLDVRRLAQHVAALGCRAIEVDASSLLPIDTVRAAARDAGLQILYASGSRVPSDADPFPAAGSAVESALALGATGVSMLPPHGAPRWDVLDRADAAGIRIHVVNEPIPGSVLQVRALVDQAPRACVTAALDIGAAALASEDPVRSLYLLNRRIGHLYLSDAKPLRGRLRLTYPGDGTVWWYGVVWALWSLGYEAFGTLAFPDDGLGLSCLDDAIDYVNRMRASRFAGSVP